MNRGLSNRGIKASKTIMRVDMEAYFEAIQNLYDKNENPNGTFPLNMAENKLSWHLLKDKIQAISREKDIPEWVAGYTSGKGSPSFREAAARFLSECLAGIDLDPELLAFSAGATSVVEMTALVLGDEGDVMAVPAPCYPVYKQDVANIANMERYDIITHHDISEIKNGLILNIDHLEHTKKEIESQGKRFKMLALTNPDNPTGGLFSYKKLLEVAEWCIENEVHLIVNEIYGLSLIDTTHPAIAADYSSELPFVSFIQIMKDKQSDYLHWWYSLSKDFGISGFRMGATYSYNEAFINAYENINYSHLTSNYTQWIMEEVFKDLDFVKKYIATNQRLLTEAYVIVIQKLRELNIEYVPSRGSLFIWADFSKFLTENTLEAERAFWSLFYEKTGILLTPGEGFGHTKRGLYRIVYPFFGSEALEVAMKRLENFVKNN
ncbi:MAG: aminotransferase class I/II-fold pyridoxal phosphate-dependent enzyme [Saprospiraceae bacterium]